MQLGKVEFQLMGLDGRLHQASGGKVLAFRAGATNRARIYDRSGGLITQPLTLTAGGAELHVDVDDYVKVGSTASNTLLTNLGSTSDLEVGMEVSGAGIPVNAQVSSIDSATQVTINRTTTATANGVTMTFKRPGGGSAAAVDLYIMGPEGHFVVSKTVKPGLVTPEIRVDLDARQQMLRMPCAVGPLDAVAATEFNTGFVLPTDCLVQPDGLGFYVTVLEASRTIDWGLLSTESGGDADGFADGLTTAAAAMVKPTLVSTGQTLGVLLRVDESGAGVLVPEQHRLDGTAKTLSYTFNASSSVVRGIILQPYVLAP